MSQPSNAQIGGLSMGATAGGSILSAFGALQSGIANKDAYDYQASIARLNQQIDTQNAEFAVQTGEQTAGQYGLRARDVAGQLRAGRGASGFDVNSGSNKQVRASQEMLSTMDLQQIRSNAAKTAYGYQEQATMAGAQASLYTMAGDNSLVAGVIGMGSSFLGGAGSVSNEWLQGQRVGLFGAGASASSGIGHQ